MLAPTGTIRPIIIFLLSLLSLLVYLKLSYHPSLQNFKVWSASSFQNESLANHPLSEIAIHDDNEQAPRIRQASMVFGDSENAVIERSLKTHFRHGKKWGNPTHVLRQDSVGGKQFGKLVFNKILYLHSLSVREMVKPPQKRCEWIVWFDSDSVLLNEDIPWSAFLPPGDGFQHVHLIGAKDWNGFNSGVFFLRMNAWTVQMLTDALALPSLRKDIDLGYNTEQTALCWVFEQSGRYEHIVYQPRPWFNGYEHGVDAPIVQSGDLLIHFAGYAPERKGPSMGKWLDRLEDGQQRRTLQIPMENTTYPHQINDYWQRLRNAQRTFDRVGRLKGHWDNITNHDDLEKKENALKKVCWEEAFNRKRMLLRIDELNKALDVAEKEKADAPMKAEKEEKERKKKEKEDERKQKEQEEAKKKENDEETKERAKENFVEQGEKIKSDH
ncbi:hypothetical protein ACLMJK_000763 [Lecanora helva]